MGHLSIVNQQTVRNIIRNGVISTRGDLKQYIVKTTADIFADVLVTRKGDLIFPWIVKGENGENIGFKYVFKVAGPPILVKGEYYPVQIPLESEGLEFENPLSEAEALDLWDRKLLWNAIGKKSLGRGRSLTHQTPMEDERILDLLNSKNHNKSKKIKLGNLQHTGEQITINASQNSWDPSLKKSLESMQSSNRLSSIKLDGIPWRYKNRFNVEKALEAWMMENLDKSPCDPFRKIVLFENMELEWFGNYLPYGVQGSNIDIVIIQSKEKKKYVTVIELKVDSLNSGKFSEAASQVIEYSLFIKRAFNAFGINVDLNPIVMSGANNRPIQVNPITKNEFTPKWVTYSISDNGKIEFNRVL